MAISADHMWQFKRMIAEDLSDTYTDLDLALYIQNYPTIDADGNQPTDGGWVESYDLHAAAAAIWEEKAALRVEYFDFNADGVNSTRSQVFAQCMKQARYHNARRQPGTIQLVVSPKPAIVKWIGNLAEVD